MNKKYFIIIIIFITSVILLAEAPVTIRSPGSRGMNSNFDINEKPEGSASFLQNTDNFTTLGMLRKRFGYIAFGANEHKIFKADGYFDVISKHKYIEAFIAPTQDITVKTKRALDDNGGAGWEWGAQSTGTIEVNDTLSYLASSDTSDANIDTTLLYSDSAVNRNLYSNQASFKDMEIGVDVLIATGGLGIPKVFTPFGYIRQPSNRDTMAYTDTISPRLIGMGLRAPGQLQAIVLPQTGNMNGPYEYTYAYQNAAADEPTGAANAFSDTAIHSIIVFPKNQKVMLTGFAIRPRSRLDSAVLRDIPFSDEKLYTRTKLTLFRRKATSSEQSSFEWQEVANALYTGPNNNLTIIDNLDSVGNNTLGSRWKLNTLDTAIAPPGSIYIDSTHIDQAIQPVSADVDSIYHIAYSFYDPQLDIESPLGPSREYSIAEEVSTDTFAVAFSLGYHDLGNAPAEYIRVYRSATGDAFSGDDIMYCIFQIHITNNRSAIQTSGKETGNIIYLGLIPDTAIIGGGVDFDAFGLDTLIGYSKAMNVFDISGASLVRPPFENGISIPFTDIEFSNDRYWGIGDSEFLQRLYYSKYNKMGDWNATEFLSLGEEDNDEILRIVSLSSTNNDILFALKHNSIFMILGYDAETDLTFIELPNKVGLLDGFSLVEHDNVIYFMSPELKIYTLNESGAVDEISLPIEDRLDSIFTDFRTAVGRIRSFNTSFDVIWVDTTATSSSVDAIKYNIPTNSWNIESYDSSFVPAGSFKYDTTVGRTGFGQFDWFIYQSDSAESFKKPYSETFSDSVLSDIGFPFPMVATFPIEALPKTQWMVTDAFVTASFTTNAYLVARILNQDGDTLTADSIKADARTTRDYHFMFGANYGKHLFLQLTTTAKECQIGDITIERGALGEQGN